MTSAPRAPRKTLAAMVALAVAACTDSAPAKHDASTPRPDPGWDCADTSPVPSFADLQRGILQVCTQCHSARLTSDAGTRGDAGIRGDAGRAQDAGRSTDVRDAGDPRHGAPPGVNFDTYDELVLFSDTATFLVRQHAMPFPDGAGVTEEQRRQLYAWAACGQPE